MTALEDQRRANADLTWEEYNFGLYEIIDTSGWEFVSGDNTWERVFFVDSEGDESPSLKGSFSVRFDNDSSNVAYASALINGVLVGRWSQVRKFVVDGDAKKYEEDYELSSPRDFPEFFEPGGMQRIFDIENDNNKEVWGLTSGGQVVRITGVDLDRVYIVPRDEAIDYLRDMLPDEVERGLVEIGFDFGSELKNRV